MPLFLTTAAPQIFSYSYHDLPASWAIFASHDSDHMIYIFIWDLEKGIRPDPWNIQLIWYGLSFTYITLALIHITLKLIYYIMLIRNWLMDQMKHQMKPKFMHPVYMGPDMWGLRIWRLPCYPLRPSPTCPPPSHLSTPLYASFVILQCCEKGYSKSSSVS